MTTIPRNHHADPTQPVLSAKRYRHFWWNFIRLWLLAIGLILAGAWGMIDVYLHKATRDWLQQGYEFSCPLPVLLLSPQHNDPFGIVQNAAYILHDNPLLPSDLLRALTILAGRAQPDLARQLATRTPPDQSDIQTFVAAFTAEPIELIGNKP